MNMLMTGGSGFLGRVIVNTCWIEGSCESLFRGQYPDLIMQGVEVVRGDISDSDKLSQAAQGIDAIIHTASKVGVWGGYRIIIVLMF